MARKTKQQAQETRQQILDAAVREFSERGVAATGIETTGQAVAGTVIREKSLMRDTFCPTGQPTFGKARKCALAEFVTGMHSRSSTRVLHVDGDTFFASCEVALDEGAH